MKILLKTKALFVISILSISLNFVPLSNHSMSVSLPNIPSIVKEDVTRIQLTQQGNSIVLENQGGEWFMVAPLQGRADHARVKALLMNFRKTIQMDALIEHHPKDEGAAYGLSGTDAIVVEIWTDAAQVATSLLIGQDAQGSSSFIRLSGDASVYRANVGGRRRFAYAAEDWLNQQVLGINPEIMSQILVKMEGQEDYLLRHHEKWQIEPALDAMIDEQKLSQAIQSLSVMRLGQSIVDTVEFHPSLNLEVTTIDGKIYTLEGSFGQGNQSIVRSSLQDGLMQVSSIPLERFAQGKEFFEDRRVFQISSRQELDMIRYQSTGVDIIIQQDVSNGFWNVLQPDNIDLEMRDIFFMVNTVAGLSSEVDLQNVEIDWDNPKVSIDIRKLMGQVLQLQIAGKHTHNGVDGYLCRYVQGDRVFIADKADIERIIQGFGQANIF